MDFIALLNQHDQTIYSSNTNNSEKNANHNHGVIAWSPKINVDSQQFWWTHIKNNARNMHFEVHSQMHDNK